MSDQQNRRDQSHRFLQSNFESDRVATLRLARPSMDINIPIRASLFSSYTINSLPILFSKNLMSASHVLSVFSKNAYIIHVSFFRVPKTTSTYSSEVNEIDLMTMFVPLCSVSSTSLMFSGYKNRLFRILTSLSYTLDFLSLNSKTCLSGSMSALSFQNKEYEDPCPLFQNLSPSPM